MVQITEMEKLTAAGHCAPEISFTVDRNFEMFFKRVDPLNPG